MSAQAELRAMVDRIIKHVALHDDTDSSSTAALFIEAATLMAGIAQGLEDASGAFELVRAASTSEPWDDLRRK